MYYLFIKIWLSEGGGEQLGRRAEILPGINTEFLLFLFFSLELQRIFFFVEYPIIAML